MARSRTNPALRAVEDSRPVGSGDFHARGAFFTPPEVATFLAEWAVRSPTDQVLEPSCGEAAFLTPIVAALSSRGASATAIGSQLFGFDIDADTVSAAQDVLRRFGVKAQLGVANFFDVPSPGQLGGEVPWVNAVVGNPPFIRYQRFSGRDRLAAQKAALRAQVRVELSGLASSWAASLVHASEFLAPDGRLAMVLPAELLTVNYAEPVRRFLHRRFAAVDLVLFESLVFDAALEDVVLLLAEGSGGCDHFRLHHVTDESELPNTLGNPLTVDPHVHSGKWTSLIFLGPEVGALYRKLADERFVPLSTYGNPRLGLVTGANRFFALSPTVIRQYSLPESDLFPISPPGTRHLRGLAFTHQDWASLASDDQPVHVLRLMDPVDESHPAWSLIQEGEAEGISNTYKCRIRDPWYVLPPIDVPDLFFTYMSHHFPRLVDNRAKVGYLNSMHGLKLHAHRTLARAALPLASFNSLTLLGAELEGRAYGGGVLKMEPREAGSLPVLSPSDLQRAWDRLRRQKPRLDRELRTTGWPRVVEEVDDVVLRDVLGLREREIRRVQEASDLLRSRRLRRGRSAS